MQTTINKKIIIFICLIFISLYYTNLYHVSSYRILVLYTTILANFILLFVLKNNLAKNNHNLLIFVSIVLFLLITFYYSVSTLYEISRFIFFIIVLYIYTNISKEKFETYSESIKLFFNILFPIIFIYFIYIYLQNLPRTSVYFSNIAYLSGFFFFALNLYIIQKKFFMASLAFIVLCLTFTKSTLLASLFLLINVFKNKYLKIFLALSFLTFLILFVTEEFSDLPFFKSEIFENYRLFHGFNNRDLYWLEAISRLSIEPQGWGGMLDIVYSTGFANLSLHSVWFDNIIIYGYLNFFIYLFLLIKFFKINIKNFPYYIFMSFITITPGGIGLFPHLILYFMTYNKFLDAQKN